MKLARIALVALAVLVLSAPAYAIQGVGIHKKVVDGVLFLVDQSGSMYMDQNATGVEKIEMAKQALVRINAKIPALGYQGAVCAVSPNLQVVAPGAVDKAAWTKGINAIRNNGPIYGRLTPLGDSFAGLSGTLSQLPGTTAAVLVSDGDENLGSSAVQALQALYSANPGLTMHFVSVANTAEGKATLAQMAGLKSGSLLVDARDIINTEEAVMDFVTTAFYLETLPADEVESLRSVYFNTAKYDILPLTAERLDKIAAVLNTRPELKIFVEGFADITGAVDYNLTLSLNRANAVRDYLVSKGCNGENIIIKGRGRTKEYPSLRSNRRADIMVIWK